MARNFDKLIPRREEGQTLLVWRCKNGTVYAADLLRWYTEPGARPMFIMARKAPGCPWPEIDEEFNLIRVGSDGFIILRGESFTLYTDAFRGCYEPLSKRIPTLAQYFPAPTYQGSVELARRVTALLGFQTPADDAYVKLHCQVTGMEMAGLHMNQMTAEAEA